MSDHGTPIDEELEDDLKELSTAEEFLDYFEIAYDQSVVHVNRLHILQRFHNYLNEEAGQPDTTEGWHDLYKAWLTKAYQDFVESDAVTEKVFKVFHDAQAKEQANFVSADSLLK